MALIVSTLFPSESTLAATTIKDTVASEYGHGYAPPLHIGDKAYALTLLAPYAGDKTNALDKYVCCSKTVFVLNNRYILLECATRRTGGQD